MTSSRRHSPPPTVRGSSISRGSTGICAPRSRPWALARASSGSVEALVAAIAAEVRPGDQVLVMSNGGFGGLHEKLLAALRARAAAGSAGPQ